MTQPPIDIRPARPDDWPGIWHIFHQVVAAGDSYPYAPDTSEDDARRSWLEQPRGCYVAEEDGRIVGTYYLKANQPGLGNHVANAGYMVDPEARGRGIGRKLCRHSEVEAQGLGFRALQFNLVVVTNEAAVHLWRDLGFSEVGLLPRAFRHSREGLVDALVMYKWLA